MNEKLPLGTELVCIKDSGVWIPSDANLKESPKTRCQVTKGMQGIICGYSEIAGMFWVSVSLPLYELAVSVPGDAFDEMWVAVP